MNTLLAHLDDHSAKAVPRMSVGDAALIASRGFRLKPGALLVAELGEFTAKNPGLPAVYAAT